MQKKKDSPKLNWVSKISLIQSGTNKFLPEEKENHLQKCQKVKGYVGSMEGKYCHDFCGCYPPSN